MPDGRPRAGGPQPPRAENASRKGSERPLSAPAYDAESIARMVALCEADPHREVCGLVVRCGGALQVEHVANAADRYHEADPARFPRTSRDSYLMDPRDLRRIYREIDERGGEVAAVWHSHVEVGAYFSAKDRADAVLDGVPAVPGAEYLVLGVRAGRVTEVKRFWWDGTDYVEGDTPDIPPPAPM
jgi:proteasome lid subunit RPN8/RPN11